MSMAPIKTEATQVWYVLRTMPQHEKKVAAYLKKKRIAHYLPLVKSKRQWSDRIKIVDLPLFPGYLFVKIDFSRHGYEILQHHGTLSYLKQEDVPVAIEEQLIEEIKAIIQAGVEIQANPIANFPPGEKVVVQAGPFKGHEAVVQKVKNKRNISIKLEAMEQYITIDADFLEKQIVD